MIDENVLEQVALDWFRETGWQTFHGKELFTEGRNPQRHQLSAVILEPRLSGKASYNVLKVADLV
ncbi:hypothetical protein [Pasteurella sp. PK-2025]|uniref:hypothetical protein n=1 Tax=Pasteurella sp. PK-2025 TaxID=3413133 RepID=UPI003C76007C